MLQILHASDFYLDAPFTALPPDLAFQRWREQKDFLTRLADLARTRKADLVFLSGNLFFDGNDSYSETVQEMAQSLGKTGCPVFIAPGNYDCYHARSPYARLNWPSNVHIFKSQVMEAHPLPHLKCTVYGCAFTDELCIDSPLEKFVADKSLGKAVGLLHGEMDPESKLAPITVDQIAQSKLDYLALGHNLDASGLQWAENTPYAYPGCPESHHFDQSGERGVLWIALEDEGEITCQFMPLATRRYEKLEIHVQEDPLEGLLAALPPSTKGDIYHITFTGESQVEGLDLAFLESQIQDKFFSVTLVDATQVYRGLWERVEEDTLMSFFLQEMEGRIEMAKTFEEKQMLERALRYGLSALEHREEPL